MSEFKRANVSDLFRDIMVNIHFKPKLLRLFTKEIDLESLQHKYQDQSTNDDFIQYEPLPQIYIDSLDDSNKEKMLQKIADRNGF